MEKIIFILIVALFSSCGTLHRSIEDQSLIKYNGYDSIVFVFYYYPDNELDFFNLYFERLEELFENSPTNISSTFVKIETFDKDFIKPNIKIQDQLYAQIYNSKADLLITVRNAEAYVSGAVLIGIYESKALDLESLKEVWGAQFAARSFGIKFKKNLSKSASSKVFKDLKKSGVII